jgi:diguanylate cyclase (GGDEF)-like protein
MTTAGKINVLFVSLALIMGCVSTGFTAYREYQHELERVTSSSVALVQSKPRLQIATYNKNTEELKTTLKEFLQTPAISFALARGGQGELLAREARNPASTEKMPSFKSLRGKNSDAEPILIAPQQDDPQDIGLWSALNNPESLMHYTIPVFSSINPTQKGLSEFDISREIAKGKRKGSVVVIGYIHLGISPAALLHTIRPVITNVLLTNLSLIVFLCILLMLVTHQLSVALAKLTQLAHEVTSGKCEKPIIVGGSTEFKQISNLLNSTIGKSKHQKSEAMLSKEILSLKVNERASQLSQRDNELSTATQEIDRTKSQLRQLAYYDSLTSLPNRRLFTEQLALLLRLNERNKTNLALVFINLDNFKRINESLGHLAGDAVLREVASRLALSLRGSDSVAVQNEAKPNIDVSRLSGDEFTVVLNQFNSTDDINAVVQRMLDALVEPMDIDGNEIVIAPNIGIAIAPDHADQVQGLFTAASAAMHNARMSIDTNFSLYSPEMDTAGAERIKLEADLRKAIERNQLVLHYQPQVDTVSGSVTGAEALLRWQHPILGLVPPKKFIALAEEIGIMSELGDWVLMEACRQMKVFQDQSLKLPKVAINISAMQFSTGFTQRVKEVITKVGLPPTMLELGLTETIMSDHNENTVAALQELKDLGIYLSVDDFGNSYSPMNYLSHYPLDEVKIDRSFVAKCDEGGGEGKLVAAIVSMAESLELKIVAEGVETEEQFRFLRSKGASVMQGYLFSKPVEAELLKPMLTPWYFAEQVQRINV